MISPHDRIAREAVAQLMGDVKAGKRETIDVDDVIAVLEAAPGAPARTTHAFELLLELALGRLAEAVR